MGGKGSQGGGGGQGFTMNIGGNTYGSGGGGGGAPSGGGRVQTQAEANQIRQSRGHAVQGGGGGGQPRMSAPATEGGMQRGGMPNMPSMGRLSAAMNDPKQVAMWKEFGKYAAMGAILAGPGGGALAGSYGAWKERQRQAGEQSDPTNVPNYKASVVKRTATGGDNNYTGSLLGDTDDEEGFGGYGSGL